MVDEQFIGYEAMKKSGGKFKDKTHFSKIIDVIKHPFIDKEHCYLLANGGYTRDIHTIVVLSESELFLNGTIFNLDIKPQENRELYKIAGKYSRRKKS